MSDSKLPPYWVLISVLSSTTPLDEKLALTLHHIALDLHERGANAGAIDGEHGYGEVRNLKKDALIGTIGGPMFEADLETPRGKGQVRFLLTRQGLELLGKSPPPSHLH